MIDYSEFDKKLTYKEDKLLWVRLMGYDSFVKAVIELYNEHKSAPLVGRILKISGSSVRQILKRVGAKINKKGGIRLKTIDKKIGNKLTVRAGCRVVTFRFDRKDHMYVYDIKCCRCQKTIIEKHKYDKTLFELLKKHDGCDKKHIINYVTKKGKLQYIKSEKEAELEVF